MIAMKKTELEAVYLCALSVSLILWLSMMGIIEKKWNWTRPQALVQNQQPGELISARNRGCPSSGVYVPCIYTHARWVTVGNSGLCCCTCVTYFERLLTPLFVDLNNNKKTAWILWQLPYVVNLGRKFTVRVLFCCCLPYVVNLGRKFTVRVLFCCCLILVFSAVLIWPALAPGPPPHPPPEFLSLLLLFFPLFC